MASNDRVNRSANFLKQFRDGAGQFKKITANQFMDVWNHYDQNGNGYIEGTELEDFLRELVTSVLKTDDGNEAVSETAFNDAKELFMDAFDVNLDGKIDISELTELLPVEENFLLLFRRDHPLDSSVEFMQTWKAFDCDHSGYIEADELKKFLRHLLQQGNSENVVTEDELITYADTILKLFDRNNDGKLQLSEMSKLLPVKENFLCRPIFKGDKGFTKDDLDHVFALYDRDKNGSIENEELHGFLKDLMELIEEDYSSEDLEESKRILLQQCDLNRDGKINKDELTMLLMSYDQMRMNSLSLQKLKLWMMRKYYNIKFEILKLAAFLTQNKKRNNENHFGSNFGQ
ncbi:calbindin-32-like isoform X3 [Octopus vulgaris]|uniref:Calbindin-32-like isoform X3 n=3 Tax=Octopus TaxID=6643 RepID=A0AA36AIK6_OCTVU|nr:calbindin-32 [Octopus sinensis]CAI9715677.1 calbindin-32-like isoform X3 [Octopus vulgaris]